MSKSTENDRALLIQALLSHFHIKDKDFSHQFLKWLLKYYSINFAYHMLCYIIATFC